MVEHATENRGVPSSILGLATIIRLLLDPSRIGRPQVDCSQVDCCQIGYN